MGEVEFNVQRPPPTEGGLFGEGCFFAGIEGRLISLSKWPVLPCTGGDAQYTSQYTLNTFDSRGFAEQASAVIARSSRLVNDRCLRKGLRENGIFTNWPQMRTIRT